MHSKRSPRLQIGVLLVSLMLAPLFVAPATAQEADNVHYIEDLPEGSELSGAPLEVGFDTWWQRHGTQYQPGTYAIVDEPVNTGSVASLNLAIDADVDDPEDQARVISYFQAAERPALQEFFDSGLDYTLMIDGSTVETVLGSTTRLVVEVRPAEEG